MLCFLLPAPQASALARQTPGYRSRLGGRGASASVQGTSFSSVIISAHPLSFKAEVQPLAEPVRMTQEKIAFVPYIVPITAGTTVEFVNLDKVFHNVFSLTPGSKFNIGRKPTGDVVSRRVDYVGQIKLFCDIHPRMNATILSLDTPYFAPADKAGTYLLSELPPGEYEIRLYHPSLKGSTEKL